MRKSFFTGIVMVLLCAGPANANSFNVMVNGSGASAYYKVADHFVVGPTFVSLSSTDEISKVSASGTGLRMNYSFNEAFSDGWYLGVELGSTSVKVDQQILGVKFSSSLNSGMAAVQGGYHWFWGNFNTMLGIAVASYGSSTIEVKDSSGTVVGTAKMPSVSGADFAIGYSF